MKLNKIFAGLIAVAACGASMASNVMLYEGFDNFGALAGKGWSLQNLSSPGGNSGWFQGNTSVFSAASGPADSYIAANFENTLGNGVISDWLMTPVVAISATVGMNFDLRFGGLGYIDTVEILFSANGNSTNVADFSLLTTLSSDTDSGWNNYAVSLEGLAGANTGRFAFRYVSPVADNANYVGIDNVNVNIVPEPTSMALVCLAMAGAAVARRCKITA